ncbi:MAG: Ppx/GppA family phosphatase [Planctomycetes bacterium]|nr:Ppx/GppA family phosphatase [Planctomycetota bacterium]
MIVAETTGPHSFRVIDRERERVKLGAGAFRSGRLRPETMDAALSALSRFALLAQRLQVDRVLAVATSAVREAANGKQFLATVKAETGIDARTISGDDEARLIYTGVRHAVHLNGRRGLILDLGGGSLEAILGDSRRIWLAESLPLGVQRLRDFFGAEDPLPRKAREALIAHVRKQAASVVARTRKRGFDTVVLTSGTHLTLGLACLRLRGRDPWGSLNGYLIGTGELQDLSAQLLDLDAAGRMRLPGIDQRRADTVHLGAAVLVTVLEMLKAEEVQLCGASLREGMVLQHLSRKNGAAGEPDVRRASALDLLRRLGGDEKRAAHLAGLALQIFDGARQAHGLAREYRSLLEAAGLLEDLGRAIHLHDREHLAYQIIRGGGLRGFSDRELEIVGLTARYSRRGAPKPRHRHYSELEPDDRHVVKILAGIMRIADGLDRGRGSVVREVRCRRRGGTLVLQCGTRGNAELELFSARRATQLLEQAMDTDIAIERA